METIEVDDEVFAYLRRASIWGEINANQTLRRLLGLDKAKEEQRPQPIPDNVPRAK